MKRLIALLAAIAALASPAFAEGDVAKGELSFKKCMACHTVADNANKVGPSLLGVVDRAAGSAEGYNYSEPMKAFGAGGAKWDVATLDAYLKAPKELVPGTKMAFSGIKKDDERVNLIAFLATKK